jgi:hypothetical protein
MLSERIAKNHNCLSISDEQSSAKQSITHNSEKMKEVSCEDGVKNGKLVLYCEIARKRPEKAAIFL